MKKRPPSGDFIFYSSCIMRDRTKEYLPCVGYCSSFAGMVLYVVFLCALQMCCNARWVIRDFTFYVPLLNVNDRSLKGFVQRLRAWRYGIRIPSARKYNPAFDKFKYLELMFGDVGQA